MNRNQSIIAVDSVDVGSLIHIVRGEQVILDSDLAFLYHTSTSAFNQAVSRNVERFPTTFRFQLTREEYDNIKAEAESRALTSQNVISKDDKPTKSGRGGRRYLPYVFTEEGVAMLSSILRSGVAVRTSIHIMRSFVEMRHFVTKHAVLFEHIKSLELRQLEYQRQNDERFSRLFDLIEENRCHKPSQKIFFEGQIYDAHSFLVDMIRHAKREIILVDSYVNINTLDVLVNKAPGVVAKVLTLPSSAISKNEIQKFNAEYPTLKLVKTTAFHDRFMIFDRESCYHIGASLKDAGEKCFAITKLEETHELSLLLERIDSEFIKQSAKEAKKLEKLKLAAVND